MWFLKPIKIYKNLIRILQIQNSLSFWQAQAGLAYFCLVKHFLNSVKLIVQTRLQRECLKYLKDKLFSALTRPGGVLFTQKQMTAAYKPREFINQVRSSLLGNTEAAWFESVYGFFFERIELNFLTFCCV